MAHDPFEDFKIPDEYLRWDRYVERARSNTNLTPEEALKAESAVLFLKKRLGDDAWLAQAIQNDHPITGYLWNNAPLSHWVLIRMAEAMEAFDQKKNSNCSNVISRLRKPDKFNEAHSVLETGYKFLRLGFEVVFDPSVTVYRKDGSPHGKIPDLRITWADTGEEIFVEISSLGRSAQQQQITRGETSLTMRLMHIMHTTGIIMRIVVHKALDQATLESTLQEIDKLASKVKTDGAFETWASEGVIELAAAPTDQAESIYQWASERGIKEGEIIEGALIDINDAKRLILDKIGKEVKQLPKDRPGMIIVMTSQSFLFHFIPMRMIGPFLSQRLQRFPQLICVAATYCHYIDEVGIPAEWVSTADYSIRERVIIHQLRETTLIAQNNVCQQPLSPATYEKICQAFA
jgi:hypothetical protein